MKTEILTWLTKIEKITRDLNGCLGLVFLVLVIVYVILEVVK